MRRSVWALLTLLPSMALGAGQIVEYSGRAVAPHSMKFLYGERHWLKYDTAGLAERVVLYTCADGRPFARKTLLYQNPTVPYFVFEDESNGMREGVRLESGERRMFFKANERDIERAAALPAIEGLVADAGFDEFVRLHWDSLLRGETASFPFLVPSRLESLNFQLTRVPRSQRDGQASETFRLKIKGLLGLVAPAIDVTYTADSRLLKLYEGLSDLRDTAGENLNTAIHFDPKDRHESTAERMQGARTVTLAACR